MRPGVFRHCPLLLYKLCSVVPLLFPISNIPILPTWLLPCARYHSPHQQCQAKSSSICVIVFVQSKLNNYQQGQSDAVDVNEDSNLFGVIESFDLDPACMEGHEHGHQHAGVPCRHMRCLGKYRHCCSSIQKRDHRDS